LQQTFSVNDIYPQNTKLLFTQPNRFSILAMNIGSQPISIHTIDNRITCASNFLRCKSLL